MPLFDVIAPVVLLVLTGFLLGRARPVEVRSLAPVSMYLFTPALVFQSLTGSSALSGDAPRLVAACVVHLVALLGFGFLLAAALGLRGKRRAAFLIPAFLYTAGNYGLPVSLFAFGQVGFHAATLVFVVNATVGNFLAGVTAAWGAGASRRAQSQRPCACPWCTRRPRPCWSRPRAGAYRRGWTARWPSSPPGRSRCSW